MKHLFPRFVEPMKARSETELPSGRDWIFEIKFDGIRAIAVIDEVRAKLLSRRPRDITHEFPDISRALTKAIRRPCVLDGEIVAFDPQGRSSFQLLQNRRSANSNGNPHCYMIFDIMNLEGRDLCLEPLLARRELLKKLVTNKATDLLRFSQSVEGDSKTVWKHTVKLGLEGIIAKRRDSAYEPGRRSGAWLKIKTHNEQEFVIGGYTAPQGSRLFFGSIAVGYYQGADLLFAARVGTGFDTRALKSLHTLFQKFRSDQCPFMNLPATRRSRFGGGLTPAEMRKCTWLKPELVCQVRFLEWTHDNNLRQPVFVGLRDDKPAARVVRELSAT